MLVQEIVKSGLIDFYAPGDSGLLFKTDSHFNSVGNEVYAYRLGCRAVPGFATHTSFAQFRAVFGYRSIEISGDLGNRFTPQRKEPAKILTVNPGSVTENGRGMRGYIYVNYNEAAPIKKRLLILGDSYVCTMRFHFAHWFESFVFCYTVFAPQDLIDEFRPDIVV